MEWRRIHTDVALVWCKNLYGTIYVIMVRCKFLLAYRLLSLYYLNATCSLSSHHCSVSTSVINGQNKEQIGSESAESNKWSLMEIYVQWSDLQLAKAKTLLVTWDYEIILTNGSPVYNDLFPFLQDEAGCSPHYLWVALKSRYRRMNVRLSVCVMGLIMVSCAPHNEAHPRRKAISSSPPVWRAAFSCF